MSESKKPRGFAALSPERRAEIARLGGLAAHRKGTGHEFNHDEAVKAGRKGGLARGAQFKSGNGHKINGS